MATITSQVSPNYTGFATDFFFIAEQAHVQGYASVFSGGGSSVTLTYSTLNLRLTYTGSNLVFSGGAPLSGNLKSITVAQYDTSSSVYRTVGVLTLGLKQSWAFADLFTSAYATSYAAGGHSITGTERMDTLEGGALADVIRPVGHDDLVTGNGGNDVLILRANGAANETPASARLTAHMGAGVDTLRYESFGGTLNLRGATLSGFEKIELTGPGAILLDAADLGGAFLATSEVVGTGGIVKFWQGTGQPFSASQLKMTGDVIISVAGTGGNDVQLGNAASRDYLLGLDGGDWLRGLGGADTLIGGDGADTLDGGGGSDAMYGGAGDDLYVVGAGDGLNESAVGGTDMVRAYASYEMDAHIENLMVYAAAGLRIEGNALANQIGGGAGADTLLGAGGGDTIAASDGQDSVSGGAGDDILNAGAGNDTLSGGSGNDRLVGNRGNDTMSGGEGADRFVFRTGDGDDRIRDFATNGDVADVIDLGDLTAVTGWADLRANHMAQVGLNVVITAGADSLTLERVWLPLLSASDFAF